MKEQHRPPAEAARLARYIDRSNRDYNAQRALTYRQGDGAKLALDGSAAHYCELIRRLSAAFNREIDVLDIGCGTGRFLNLFTNVRRLVGIDTSPHMLEQARNPVRSDELHARIELICGDVYSLGPEQKFDFIYSVGVLGEFAPLDAALLRQADALLKPGGVLFTTAVDTHSRMRIRASGRVSPVRKAVRKVFRRLPPGLRGLLNRYLSPCYVTRAQVEEAFALSAFRKFNITPYRHTGGWKGTHFDCVAHKDAGHA